MINQTSEDFPMTEPDHHVAPKDHFSGFSIIVPVKEINDYIRQSVPITLQIDYDNYEIIILPNEPLAQIPDFLRHPKIKLIPSGRVSPAVKRDLGAQHSQYSHLAFLDDDAYPTTDWLLKAEDHFRESPGLAAIGGPAVTPKDNSLGQHASGLFFETFVGGGGLDYRYRPKGKNFYVDDFPSVNLIVSKKSFNDIGGFDSHYWPGEDSKLCHDLITNGHRILYCSDVIVYHHRRRLLAPHLKQVGNYGLHRGFFAKKFPENSRKLVYFVPSLFVTANLGLLILSFFSSSWLTAWTGMILIYLGVASVDISLRTKHFKLAFLALVTIVTSHLIYGIMFMRGFFLLKDVKSQLR